jgi:drug/metabolite transporter (DMT)-like permease
MAWRRVGAVVRFGLLGALNHNTPIAPLPCRFFMQNHSVRGILYLCIGVFIFSLQDAIIKGVSGTYALTEVVCIRSCVGLPLLLALVQREVGWRALIGAHWWPLTLRATIMFGAYTAYYMAFPALPLADAIALYFTVPLFLTALAGPVLGEHLSWKVWAAVLLGFFGVLVMLQPGSGLFEAAGLLSLLSAALYGTAMLMARKMGGSQVASVMSFYQNAIFLLGSGLGALVLLALGKLPVTHPSLVFLLRPWTLPSLRDGALIASCGVIAAVAMTFLTNAYRVARTSIVAPFEYTGILWAPLWGFLFFSEVPKPTTVLGAGIIGIAGLLAMRLAKH